MIEICRASLKDIDAVVKIHEKTFRGFFLTKLGSSFLYLYYKSVLNNADGILFVSRQNDKIIGLCAGTMLSAGFNTRLIKDNIIRYGLESLKLLFVNPKYLLHLIKNMSKEDSRFGDDGNYAELLSIGVDPNVQRSGAGREMLLKLEAEVKKRGGKKLSLTTDYKDNEKAINFYKSQGYEPWYDFLTYPNRRMYRMIKYL